jgi:8-oxo-dGTP pyrophosphatase MutT (NUDIX family)
MTAPGELHTQVSGFVPRTVRETESHQRFLGELARLVRPLDRHADASHVTGSGLVLGRRGTVLHLHKRIGLWLQPGGHVEPGEDPAEAARREAAEETGLPVVHPPGGPELLHLDVHPASGHLHLDLRYVLLAPDRDPAPGPEESPHARWFSLAEAEAVADAGLVDALARARTWWESWSEDQVGHACKLGTNDGRI